MLVRTISQHWFNPIDKYEIAFKKLVSVVLVLFNMGASAV